MQCPKCGATNPDDVQFCSLCYARFDAPAQPSDPGPLLTTPSTSIGLPPRTPPAFAAAPPVPEQHPTSIAQSMAFRVGIIAAVVLGLIGAFVVVARPQERTVSVPKSSRLLKNVDVDELLKEAPGGAAVFGAGQDVGMKLYVTAMTPPQVVQYYEQIASSEGWKIEKGSQVSGDGMASIQLTKEGTMASGGGTVLQVMSMQQDPSQVARLRNTRFSSVVRELGDKSALGGEAMDLYGQGHTIMFVCVNGKDFKVKLK